MTILRKYLLLYFIAALSLAGCQGCLKRSGGSAPTMAKATDSHHLSGEKLFSLKPSFQYSSHLDINFVNGAESEVNNESIDIVGKNGRLHLKKKIDNYHFFELIQDDEQFFIKNLAGAWRSGQDNKPYYMDIIDDGFNLYSWLVDNFDLNDVLNDPQGSGSKKDRVQISSYQIPATAPIMNMLAQIDGFKENVSGRLNGFVELDGKTKLPKLVDMVAEINGDQEKSAQIHAKMSLSFEAVKSAINIPIVAKDEVLKNPVNIKPRFLELIGKNDNSSSE